MSVVAPATAGTTGRLARLRVIGALLALYLGSYLLVTRFSASLPAAAVRDFALPIDARIPYVAWTWPFYWLAYPFVVLGGGGVLLALPRHAFRPAAMTVAALTLVGMLVQLALPSRAPWPERPRGGPAADARRRPHAAVRGLPVDARRLLRAGERISAGSRREDGYAQARAGSSPRSSRSPRSPRRSTTSSMPSRASPSPARRSPGGDGRWCPHGLTVREAGPGRGRDFESLPWHVRSAGSAAWTPPLPGDERRRFDPRHNPALEGTTFARWVAWRGGDAVGRIAAFAPDAPADVGYFGFFESVDAPDVATALLRAAERWLAERGARACTGPSPSTRATRSACWSRDSSARRRS